MIYEVRTYTLRPGSVARYEQRFADGLPVREKYSKLAAFWHTEIGPLNQVIHVWPYENLQHREEVRAAATGDESGQWPPKGDDLLLKMESEILQPAPFMRPMSGPQQLGGFYEMRTYTYQAGAIARVLERWDVAIGPRERHSPLAACWYNESEQADRFIHVWPYPDLGSRTRVRAEAQGDPTWPPQTGEWLVSQENKILIPAAFSPLR